MYEDLFLFRWEELPSVTEKFPGTGGFIRRQPEDFRVTELPSYLPQGSGSHTYVRVRKRVLATRDLVTALLHQGLREQEIGVAGLKDKFAVTEQWLSVPNRHAEALAALEQLPGVSILEVSRHKNKLGIGHLRGNRFRIVIRDAEAGAAQRAAAVLAHLKRTGVPNYFGPQRFGRYGTNALDGLRLLRGERVPGGRQLKRFFLSALQSLIFNALLARRITRGLFDRVVVGDWARKHLTGGTFLVEDESEAARAQALEISATLPLYGRRVRLSTGEAGSLEGRVLERYSLSWQDFGNRRGDRRLSRLSLGEVELGGSDEALILTFTLPKGAYATTLLREVMKTAVDEPQLVSQESNA